MNKTKKRSLSPYEKNQLRKYGIAESIALSTQSPVEYLTNHVDFCGLDFYVNQDVLIPRIETEELVAMAIKTSLELYQLLKRPIKIVDVGTGSGAIPIAVAKSLLESQTPFEFLASDLSLAAIKIAKKNAARLLPQAPISFRQNNLLENIEQKFDLIISNLPYIPTQRINYLSESVKDFEPHLALDGGQTGLKLIYQMIKQAEKLVYPHSQILLEVDYTHSYDDFNEFRKTWKIVVTPDSSEGVHFVKLSKK